MKFTVATHVELPNAELPNQVDAGARTALASDENVAHAPAVLWKSPETAETLVMKDPQPRVKVSTPLPEVGVQNAMVGRVTLEMSAVAGKETEYEV